MTIPDDKPSPPITPFDPEAKSACAEVPPKDTTPKTVFAREVTRHLQGIPPIDLIPQRSVDVPAGVPAIGLVWHDLVVNMDRMREIRQNKLANLEPVHPSLDNAYCRLKEAKMWVESFMGKEL